MAIRAQIETTSVAGYIGCVEAIRKLDILDRIGAIELPTLVIVGEDDPGTPVSAAEAIHARISQSELVVLPNASHFSNIEQADAFTDALMEFLRRH
jgi:3-oxoadipate enol-lactonase